MICMKTKEEELMTIIANNNDVEPKEAEEYFIAIVSVALSLKNEMRKDITSIYNQNKFEFLEKARKYSGYNHILLNGGDLEQEICAKKALGILLSAEESELIKGKILRLIKKYYKDVYVCVQNNNYESFRKKLYKIEDSDKSLKLTEMWIVLYFYTMKLMNVDLINIAATESAFTLAGLFYNFNPLNADIQGELKRENRLAKVEGIIKNELGLIRNSSDILYTKNNELKPIISYLRNLFIIDKVDIDRIVSKVNQDDLNKVMLALLKTSAATKFDNTQIVQSVVFGYLVKMLLNQYLKAKELYFSQNEENLSSELRVLKEKYNCALLEKDNAEIQAKKLTHEIANYELKLKDMLLKQSKSYEERINKLNKEVDGLKNSLDREMKNRQELFQLREFFFELRNDYLPTETSLDLSKIITDKKLLIIGGTQEWRKRLKDKFPAILTMDGFNDKIEFRSFGEIDFVLFYTGYMSHNTYYKIVDFLKEKDIPLGYIGKTNIDLVECEIVEQLNRRFFVQ
ncbi:hypothetical protein [Desulfosporosinus sp. FKA]|uniref:hypothetical protein n=1 Tax=Desulfosporosinus sp. FKA TaxID=1969834 RepID=UPI001FA88A79|nr:hypothetical protein [Desulfosporosinus sp. FKA]